jgi:hypothetical protein
MWFGTSFRQLKPAYEGGEDKYLATEEKEAFVLAFAKRPNSPT